MIEPLVNCPNCGGSLNEAGRCVFCGSKIYDFMSIDFSKEKYPTAKAFVRIKDQEGRIILAPVIVDSVELRIEPSHPDNPFILARDSMSLDIHCAISGNVIMVDRGGKA